MSELTAKNLKSRGYRVISINHRLASRIDRADWESHLKDKGFAVDADLYRRVFSKDVIEFPRSYLKVLGNSCHSTCGYKPAPEVKE